VHETLHTLETVSNPTERGRRQAEYLRSRRPELRVRHVVLLCDNAPVRTANGFAQVFTGAQVTVLTRRSLPPDSLARARAEVSVGRCRTVAEIKSRLAELPTAQVVTDAWEPAGDRYQVLVPQLAPDGVYIDRRNGVLDLAAYAYKLHDDAVDEALTESFGPYWGEVVHTIPGGDPVLTGSLHTNDERHLGSFQLASEVPALHLRRYDDVVCAPRQLAVKGHHVLPISFHQPRARKLRNRSAYGTELDANWLKTEFGHPVPRLAGAYYHLDSEFPWHFGHFITQDVAKLWGWRLARERHPDLKILLSMVDPTTGTPGGGPRPHQLSMLRALGIEADRVVCINGPVRVDELYGATPLFYQAHYAHPTVLPLWEALGRGLRRDNRCDGPELIYVSRRGVTQRACSNEPELESLFRHYGFAVVHPETLSVEQQAAAFSGARVVAGCAGSGLFNTIFARRPGRRIVFGPVGYRARNEWTMAAVRGDDYHHFFGPAETDDFHSPFAFDFEADGPALELLLHDLT
jgi:capsular polysaccharide biosynthesis protein